MFAHYPPVRSTASDALSIHHPGVRIVPKLEEKSKRERIARCVDRIRMSRRHHHHHQQHQQHQQHHHHHRHLPCCSGAVDTLYRALIAIRNDPENTKFRTIDKTTPGYRRSLAGIPGAEDLLHAMNFRAEGASRLVLDRFMVDPALLHLGISALEQTRLTEEYKESKRRVRFSKTIADLLKQNASSIIDDNEARRRAEHARQVPIEPSGRRGAFLQVHVAEDTVFRRRFDGDDTLDNVLHWLASEKSSTFYTNVMETREWCLVDRNRYPIQPLDCQGLRNQTLQYIGCWPSGKLEIMPSTDEWMEHGRLRDDQQERGSSRGLASAPSDVL